MLHLKYSFFDRLVCKDSRNRENQESKETLFTEFDILKSKYWRCKWSVATVWNITVNGKLTVYFYFHVMWKVWQAYFQIGRIWLKFLDVFLMRGQRVESDPHRHGRSRLDHWFGSIQNSKVQEFFKFQRWYNSESFNIPVMRSKSET